MTVQGRKPERPLSDGWSATPSYRPPWFRSYHHEFLERVTPEEFRSATLYPIGIPVLQVVDFLVKDIKAANRKKGEANAREEVRRALEHSSRAGQTRTNPAASTPILRRTHRSIP